MIEGDWYINGLCVGRPECANKLYIANQYYIYIDILFKWLKHLTQVEQNIKKLKIKIPLK